MASLRSFRCMFLFCVSGLASVLFTVHYVCRYSSWGCREFKGLDSVEGFHGQLYGARAVNDSLTSIATEAAKKVSGTATETVTGMESKTVRKVTGMITEMATGTESKTVRKATGMITETVTGMESKTVRKATGMITETVTGTESKTVRKATGMIKTAQKKQFVSIRAAQRRDIYRI